MGDVNEPSNVNEDTNAPGTNFQLVNWAEIYERCGPGISMIISGCRRSGKSYACKDICQQMGRILKPDLACLISGTGAFNPDFDYIPEQFKFSAEDLESSIEQIVTRQIQIIMREKQRKKENPKYRPKDPFHVLIILDDVADRNVLRFNQFLTKLYVLGRHIYTSVITLTQRLTALNTKIRANSDVVCMFRSPSIKDVKIFQEEYMFLSHQDRNLPIKCLNKLFSNEPYRMAVISVYKIQEARQLDDYIYYFKADEVKDYRLGRPEFWEQQDKESKGSGLNNRLLL